jgi:hexosaminidase
VDQRKHLLGVQANIWTEYLITPDRITWMLFPRAAALAEIGWSAGDRRNWPSFEDRLVVEMDRYRKLGIGFDPEAFRPHATESLEPVKHVVSVTLSNQTTFGTIRFTTDGSPVTASSTAYAAPLTLPLPSQLRSATFENGMVPGSDVTLDLNDQTVRRRYSQQLKLCSNEPAIGMEQDPPTGDRPVVLANYHSPCWIYKAADLAGVTSISAEAIAIPYVFADGANKQPVLTPTRTPNGELEVHLDTCSGKLLASIPFEQTDRFNVTQQLNSALPLYNQTHDLCLQVVRPALNPLWVLNWVQLNIAAGK